MIHTYVCTEICTIVKMIMLNDVCEVRSVVKSLTVIVDFVHSKYRFFVRIVAASVDAGCIRDVAAHSSLAHSKLIWGTTRLPMTLLYICAFN